MELDDFKSAWQSLDHRLQLDNTLKLLELRERRLDKARGSLRPLFWGQVAQILFGIPFILLASLLWMSQPAHASSIVAGVVVQAYGVLTIVAAGIVLGQLGNIDYSQPVLVIQKQLLHARTLYVRSGMIAGLPWWFLWVAVVQTLAGLGDVDLLVKAPAFVWSGYGIGIAGLLATGWFHRWARRPQRAEFGRKMDDSLSGRSLRNAQAQLDELQRFERD
ncbi:serine/threonine protein kinase [Luteibacter flocculans]|uniref:Serine/threonine protein kinase n=1 Tax=Luteibacter flocculans TaxID=2780091 RepID=A0ABY4T151_9GAMM|nr:serine/threonine protein kinase [Luteibacter flocculans]URL58310.1 serine/threonine protein kinase [Luteibacter flocculans]